MHVSPILRNGCGRASRFIRTQNSGNAMTNRVAHYNRHAHPGFASSDTYHNIHNASASAPSWHGTTILCVRKDDKVCMMGDGMVSMGNLVVKPNAKKIRRIGPSSGGKNAAGEKDGVGGTIVGFAGSTADAFTLLERLEGKLDEYPNQLARSCVELAKGWRTDKYLRRLEASLIVADATVSLELTGNGDVLESHDGILSVGSGGPYALAAARALIDQPLDAEEIARRAMQVASEMCVYTNDQFMIETITIDNPPKDDDK